MHIKARIVHAGSYRLKEPYDDVVLYALIPALVTLTGMPFVHAPPGSEEAEGGG